MADGPDAIVRLERTWHQTPGGWLARIRGWGVETVLRSRLFFSEANRRTRVLGERKPDEVHAVLPRLGR